jgi:hypothetical protein
MHATTATAALAASKTTGRLTARQVPTASSFRCAPPAVSPAAGRAHSMFCNLQLRALCSGMPVCLGVTPPVHLEFGLPVPRPPPRDPF